jgi:hypothetical protein
MNAGKLMRSGLMGMAALMLTGFSMGPAGAAGPVVAAPAHVAAAPHAVAPAHRAQAPHIATPMRNPHLHGANNPKAEKEASAAVHKHTAVAKGASEKEHSPAHAHDFDAHRGRHLFHHRWDFVSWVGLHRGWGSVRGEVTSGGRGVSGAIVSLRSRHNRTLVLVSHRHITRSGADGTFVMYGVRHGSYHVHASAGRSSKSSGMVVVRTGSTSHAAVHL